MKIGIIGLGQLHPRSYMAHFQASPGAEVVAVAEADAGLRAAFCQDFKLQGYATVAELLQAVQLDVAAIFLPHVDCPAAAAQWKGDRDASKFAPHCAQAHVFDDMVFQDDGPSEDCLYLNVWTPSLATSAPVSRTASRLAATITQKMHRAWSATGNVSQCAIRFVSVME